MATTFSDLAQPLADVLRVLDRPSAQIFSLCQTIAAQRASLLTADAAAAVLRLDRSEFLRLVAAGKFPRPVRVGGALKRWRRDELCRHAWASGAAAEPSPLRAAG